MGLTGSSSNWITVHPTFRLLFGCRCWLGEGAGLLYGEVLEVTCLSHTQDYRGSPGQAAFLLAIP